MDADKLLYGEGLEELFQRVKRETVRTRLVQGAGLLIMALVLLGALLYTRAWWLILFILFAAVFGSLPLGEARRFARHMRSLKIHKAGIEMPMPLRALHGRAFIPATDVARVDLHTDPYVPLVEIQLKAGYEAPVAVIEKEFIFDWFGFVDALRQLGLPGVEETFRRPGATVGRYTPNPYGVRRLRGQFVGLGLILGAVVAFVWTGVPDKAVGLGVAVPAVLLILVYLVYVNRSVPIRLVLAKDRFVVRTLAGTREFPLHDVELHVGGASVTIRELTGRIRQFDFVDPGTLGPLRS